MVDTHKIASVAKDVLLAPVYFHQGRRIKRNTVRLPEPTAKDADSFHYILLLMAQPLTSQP